MTDEKYVKRYLEFSYCYEFNGTFRICNFPGRDGVDIGKGKTAAQAWKQARQCINKK